jgi:hypothetical protein
MQYTDFLAKPGAVPPADLISPEQAIYNDLAVAFNTTPVGGHYGQSTGCAPLNFLQIWPGDIDYANSNSSNLVPIVVGSGSTVENHSFQDLLDTAALQLAIQTCESNLRCPTRVPTPPGVPPDPSGYNPND